MRIVRFLSRGWVRLVATSTLGVLGFVGDETPLWVRMAVVVCAVAILVSVFPRGRWNDGRTEEYKAVLGRALGLLADLGNLTGGEFDLWVVDLYLPKSPYSSWPPGRNRRLRLELRVTLTSASAELTEVAIEHPLIGSTFAECRPVLWWDGRLAPSTEDNYWSRLDRPANEELVARDYGVISAHAVTDNVRADCRGVLVVHVEHDAEVVTKVLGALQQRRGKRTIERACQDISNHLRDG